MRTSNSRININAPKAKVWAALTRPDLVKQWQYGADLITTWVIGSRIVFRAEWQGQVFEQWGTVLDFHPMAQLRYSLFAPRPDLKDLPENCFEMIYAIQEQNGVTAVTITQNDPRPVVGEPSAEASDAESSVLQALKSVAESL